MILLVATLLVAASGYAESKDSLKVENVMSVENPERVTITESDNRLMVEIDGKKDNPSFRYVREVEISPSDVSVTKERSGNWDFNIPFRKRTSEQRHKRNEFVVKDFKIGLSTVQGAPDNMDVSMGSSWEITTPTFGWAYYPWNTETSLSIGLACSWRNYRMTGKHRFVKMLEQICISTAIPRELIFSFHVLRYSAGQYQSCLLMKQEISSVSVWAQSSISIRMPV